MTKVVLSTEKLALEGGRPVRKAAFRPWPFFDESAVSIAAKVLRSGRVNYWTGTEGRKFEEEFAAAVGIEHAIALANGTVALEAALRVLGVGPGDEVIVTCRTFLASASAIVMVGAKPVFADVDLDSQNTTPETIRACITRSTRAIIAVHLAGWPCDMPGLMDLAKQHRLYVIEDCAQSHGARIANQHTGTFGHIGAYSFCQDKIMTTGGEGGMVVTRDRELWSRMWSFKDHGKSFDTVFNKTHPPGFRWLHESFGTNWRLTEMQSAIGRYQLGMLSSWVETRRANATYLANALSQCSALRVPVVPAEVFHSYYKYYVFVRPERLREGWNRDRVMNAINAEGIPCFSGSCSEIYLEKAFEGTSFRPARRLSVAKELGETALMFLVHPTLDDRDMRDTADAVTKVLNVATA